MQWELELYPLSHVGNELDDCHTLLPVPPPSFLSPGTLLCLYWEPWWAGEKEGRAGLLDSGQLRWGQGQGRFLLLSKRDESGRSSRSVHRFWGKWKCSSLTGSCFLLHVCSGSPAEGPDVGGGCGLLEFIGQKLVTGGHTVLSGYLLTPCECLREGR